MNKKTNVLVFPCGAESALEIHLALKNVMNIRLVGASKIEDHGRMVYQNYYGNFPNISENHFIEELNELIVKESIDLILPTHDSVLVYMARNKDKIKTKIAVPGLWQTEVCRSKKKIYNLFKNFDFNPTTYRDINSINEYPCYAKLDEGQGSKGAFVVENRSTLENLGSIDDYVLMELLPGEELTIDCFTDRNAQLLFMGPRTRERMVGGVSVKSKSVTLTEEISRIGHIVSNTLKIRGAWYFQLKKDKNGKFKLLEASTKVAGNMNVFRGQGVNFPLLMVYDYLGYDVKIQPNHYTIEVERALFSRYNIDLEYHTIYIDFDDTITHNERVNPEVMLFLYHQKNKGRRILLISKHQGDLYKTLSNLSISESLFNEIIHISMDDEKYKYIKETEGVIFVDNAYGERLKIQNELNIPVFDVDMLGVLIDWRA